jgi:RNA polymerase sigma factor (sigma-70 family)
VEASSALTHLGAEGVRGPTPLLRLQSDERLVALTRRGNQAAYEALVARYQSRLLAFCRHMLSSREDAEDVLQEVFAAAFNAMMADERTLNVRPWLYRIARNRSLNHLRRTQAIGVDSMDVHLSEHGTTTADKVHKREEFRQLMADVQDLPETQRTALLLREIDALSYEQIAEAMETTVPSIKSLLVRARVSLAEAAEARMLTCEEVRDELGEVAEGLKGTTAPVRRHLRGCDRCVAFRKSLRQTNKALAAMLPVGPLLLLKKLVLANLGTTASAGSSAAAAAGAGAAGAAGAAGGGAVSAGMSVVASKAAATVAAAAIVTVGTVEVDQVRHRQPRQPAAQVKQATAAPAVPQVVASEPQPAVAPPAVRRQLEPARHTEGAATKDGKARTSKASSTTKKPRKVKPGGDTPLNGGAQAPAATPASAGGAAAAPTAPTQTPQTAAPPAQQPGTVAPGGGVAAPAEPTAPPASSTPAPTPPPAQTTPTGTTASPPPQPSPAPPTSTTGGVAPPSTTPAGG